MYCKGRCCSMAVGFAVSLLGVAAVCPGQVCVTDAGSDVRICVDWSEPSDPVIGTDFTVDYTVDPDNPNIELITGALFWQVWAEDKNNTSLPANIGTVSANGA